MTYFSDIFKLNQEKELENVVEDIYRYLFIKCEIPVETSIPGVSKELRKLRSFSNLDDDKFDQTIKEYLTIIKLLSSNDLKKFEILSKEYQDIIDPLYNSYVVTFGKQPLKGCVQEMVYPSEVICGYTDIKLDSKIKTALQSLY